MSESGLWSRGVARQSVVDGHTSIWVEGRELYDPWPLGRQIAADFIELARGHRRSISGVMWFVGRWGALGVPSRGADRAGLALALEATDPLGAHLLRQEALVPPTLLLPLENYLESAARYEVFVGALESVRTDEYVSPTELRERLGPPTSSAERLDPAVEVEQILIDHVIEAVGNSWERPSIRSGELVPIKLYQSLLVPIYWSTSAVHWAPCHYPGCSSLRGYAMRPPRVAHCEAHVRICPRRDEHDGRAKRRPRVAVV